LDDSEVVDEQTWVLKNWRRNELLKKEHSEDGIEDLVFLPTLGLFDQAFEF
jgi:hypothetical protein